MRHVLVCDDEKDIVAALKIYLEAEGYHVLTAFNGREALEVFAREPVDLILLDIMMPGMDGITTMSRLREQSKCGRSRREKKPCRGAASENAGCRIPSASAQPAHRPA